MVDQRRFDNQPRDWVSSKQATKLLGISLRTLYAYVSRGEIRSMASTKGRVRLYARADLDRHKARRDARAGHGAVAAGALRWGEPVLDSAITAITPRGPAYRGKLAVDLAADRVPFENVAELLWSGELRAEPITWPRATLPFAEVAHLVPKGVRPIEVMSLIVALAGLVDPSPNDAAPEAIVMRFRRLVPLLAAALAPDFTPAIVTRALGARSVAAIAARALGLEDSLAPTLEVALVVLADHELNASSFAARIAASTGAAPHACITAALATLSGPAHGTAVEAVVRFADGLGSPEQARTAVRALRKRGELPPGFGHPLYPAGDPRTTPLLAIARASSTRRARSLVAFIDAFDASQDGEVMIQPSVDVGLAALVAALDLPAGAGSGLFAIARSAGWLAHVLEQRTAGFLLRPRARYVGVPV